MLRAPFEVSGEEGSFRIVVPTMSMRRAEEALRSRYPGCDVRLVFPIDGHDFFADSGRDEVPETKYLVPEGDPTSGEGLSETR